MISFERPTEPMKADCGHLCNCFPMQHPVTKETVYDHDIFPIDSLNYDNGTECGRCYRARMDKETAHMTMQDVVRAFGGK